MKHDDEKCFWTDTYYSSMDKMEHMYKAYGLKIIEHFAQDGMTPLLREKVDSLNANYENINREVQTPLFTISHRLLISGLKTRFFGSLAHHSRKHIFNIHNKKFLS